MRFRPSLVLEGSVIVSLLWLYNDNYIYGFRVPTRPIVSCTTGVGIRQCHVQSYSTVACAARRLSDNNVEEHENKNQDDDENSTNPKSKRRSTHRLRQFVNKAKWTAAYLTPIVLGSTALFHAVPAAHAGAPVMAIPKTKAQDPIQTAFEERDQVLLQEAQAELRDFMAKAREVEKEKGPQARELFERQYKEAQEAKVAERVAGLKQLKYSLLEQGIIPSVDIEGTRQVILYERGVDLATVGGTPFFAEKMYQERQPETSFAYKKAPNREIVKYMVQDLKNRGLDPLDYFEKRPDKAEVILNLPPAKAVELARQYAKNIDLYGQIAPPAEGEKSAKELMAERAGRGDKGGKEELKRLKAEEKAKAAAEKAEAKAKAAAEKAEAKAKAAAEKAEAKAKAAAEKAEAKIKAAEDKARAQEEQEAAAAAAAAAAAVSTFPVGELVDSVPSSGLGEEDAGPSSVSLDGGLDDDGSAGAVVIVPETTSPSKVAKSGGIPIIPASAAVLAVGGGAFVLKTVRDRSVAAEAERQRRYKLLMGEVSGTDDDVDAPEANPASGSTLSDLMYEYENRTENEDNVPVEVEFPVTKKRKSGLKSVFRRKQNERETDIAELVATGAKSPEFAKILAKILTFGAPGRFPDVVALPGAMPMETFDFDEANKVLIKVQEEAGLTKEESAEIFADVVNCMLIDIVDLASTSLKEKDDKATVNAINIVVQYMDHAASLFNSIAEGVTIEAVTYGGDISKGKLEQMYVAFAMSSLTGETMGDNENIEDRLSLLQSVFQINDKKAEGLFMKAFQRKMMEDAKSGNMKGFEEMMKAMGDMGLSESGGEPDMDPQQIKEMLLVIKQLKDEGSMPPEAWLEARKNFKDAFGSTLDDLVKSARESGEEMSPEEKELLDLVESVLS